MTAAATEIDITMDAKLIERLKKLLNVANAQAGAGATDQQRAGTEAEAAAAMEMLQSLLKKHNLDIAMLESKGSSAKPGVVEQGHDLGKAAFKWKLNLADVLADHFYCVSLTDHSTKTVRFAGRPDNIESLQMLYRWLIEQIKVLSAEDRKNHQEATGEHVDPLRWQVNFGLGVVHRLSDRLAAIKTKMEKEAEREQQQGQTQGESTALVRVQQDHERELNDWLEETHGYRTDGKPTKREIEMDNKLRLIRQQDAELLKDDPDAYYAKYPWRHPDHIARERKKAERAERRRAKYIPKNRYQEWSPERERREEQAGQARSAGRKAGDRVNLTPFIGGGQVKKGDLK